MVTVDELIDSKDLNEKKGLFRLDSLVRDKLVFLKDNISDFKYLSLFNILEVGVELPMDSNVILVANVGSTDIGTVTEDIINHEEINIIARCKDYKNNYNQIQLLKGLTRELYELFYNVSNPLYDFKFYNNFKITSKFIYEDNLNCRTVNLDIKANTAFEYKHYEDEFHSIKLMVDTYIE